MKTVKIISALSLMMIFAGIYNAYSINTTDRPQMISKNNIIRYEVNVYLDGTPALCNTYWVEVTDETGRLIAPAKIFVPGTTKYIFTESAPLRGRLRIAMLVISPDTDPYICTNQLNTRPDVKMGPFQLGQTYPYVLRPEIKSPLYIDR